MKTETSKPESRGGIYAESQNAKPGPAKQKQSASAAADALEKWYTENRNRLNEYPQTTLDQAFKKAAQFLREEFD